MASYVMNLLVQRYQLGTFSNYFYQLLHNKEWHFQPQILRQVKNSSHFSTHLWCFERHSIHTMSSANVSRIQPVHLERPRRLMFPTEEVRMSNATCVPISCVPHSISTGSWIRQGESTLSVGNSCTKCQHRKYCAHHLQRLVVEWKERKKKVSHFWVSVNEFKWFLLAAAPTSVSFFCCCCYC